MTIHHGDNLGILQRLRGSVGATVTLAYLDPPYNTGRVYETREGVRAFDDRWSCIQDHIDHLRPRLEAVRELLAPHGCCVVHVDYHAAGYVRVLGDEVFGPDCFASEIVWRYRRWPAKTRNFQRVHDTLFRWVRDPESDHRWNQLYEPLAPSTLRQWGTGKQLAEVDQRGRRRRSTSTSEPSPGVPLGDVWDLPIIAPCARERTGYPTQKPSALLERLISACTNEGDLVLDPYMGSGTTIAAAERLGRRAIGIDSSEEAVRIASARLAEAS
jgi:site-specific DNA-methyltransferase (adenine-specific)